MIVSAAAGSGKTAVLARRCAYLVCDAPPEARCGVDELLVLTFTEAAAAEMRSRIVEVLRSRAGERPDDRRLREQVLQVDAARISTIHAFCLWMLRRWFNQADLDPAAAVLDPDEALLLQQETLDKLCDGLYATDDPDEPILGRVTPPPPEPRASARADEGPQCSEPQASARADAQRSDNLNSAFQRLVDDYGLGEDRQIKQLMLKLARFLASLPEPRVWLDKTLAAVITEREATVCRLLCGLEEELVWQQEFCAQRADELAAGDPAGHAHAEGIREYAEKLNQWQQQLPPGNTDPSAALPQYQKLLDELAAYKLKSLRAPKLTDDAPAAAHAARDHAKRIWDQVRKLWSERLAKPFGAGSTEAWLAGLATVAPYTDTIAKLVTAFSDAYREAKRRQDVMDFADQERLAYELLTVDGDPQRPSELARQLQKRFAHVLVDEFQDISPIQEAIIRLASREADPKRPNNLFVVGDVKQSIYRFRLAEPSIFLERLARFRVAGGAKSEAGGASAACSTRTSARVETRGSGRADSGQANSGQVDSFGRAIPLQQNFRSRPEILDAVNYLFERLMRPELGAITYDVDARLKHPDPENPPKGHYPVELHVLPRQVQTGTGEDEPEGETPSSPQDDPALWETIDREAYLIAQRIHTLRAEVEQQGTELDYRDVVVLLRAASFNAERVVAGLTAQGIPAYTQTGGSLLNAREVRNVLSVLQVLDNFQQDIPLAAVLRHGLLQEALTDDELVEVRLIDRSIPFHAAVSSYAERGSDEQLRSKLGRMLGRIERYRKAVQREPLAQVLDRLYEESGYLAYVGGEVNGTQRRANLLKLHERARRFGAFRRQGLHRFLRFLEAVEEEGRDFGSASPLGEAGSVVRVMTIHQSKGLEFPVVFVAGLGSAFNLGDRSGRMIFEREAGLGLRGVDPERMSEYPTATHRLVVQEVERTAREEELRVLYVALTRARGRLILVASTARPERFDAAPSQPAPPTLLELATARGPLDWLESALNDAGPEEVQWGDTGVKRPLFTVQVHSGDDIANWAAPRQTDTPNNQLHQAVASCAPLPPDEPLAPDDPEVEQILERIEYQYPQLAAASVPAVRAASEVKGAFSHVHNPEEQTESTPAGAFAPPPSKYAPAPAASARTRGIVTHRVLEHLDFSAATDAAGVASELHRLIAVGLLAPGESDLVDEEGLVWFAGTELAARLRQGGAQYRREFKFVAREDCSYFDPTVGPLPDDAVLVRGIVDGVLVTPDGLEIVDFKTDRVAAAEVPERVEHYRNQVELYTRAAHRLWGRPVRNAWLVFLTPRVVAEVGDLRYDAAV